MQPIRCLKFRNVTKSGGQFAVAFPHCKLWGTRPPVTRDLRPCWLQLFAGLMPFLSPIQQRQTQSTEETTVSITGVRSVSVFCWICRLYMHTFDVLSRDCMYCLKYFDVVLRVNTDYLFITADVKCSIELSPVYYSLIV